VAIFLDRLFSGLTDGAIYTMIALSLVVVFRSSKTINFAQGEFALFTCFLAWWLNSKGIPLLAALAIVMVVGFAMGAVVERTLIRSVRRRSETAVLIVCLGLFIGLNGADGWIWNPIDKVFPTLLPSSYSDYIDIAGAHLSYDSIGILLIMALVVAILTLLFNRTTLGLQMRAVATNAESASLSGVKVGRILSLSWGLASAIGALAGVLLVPVLPPNELDLSQFFPILIFASAAALFGGLDSMKGAVVGGLGLGVAESMLNSYVTFLGGSLQLAVALVIIVVVLVFKPTGVFGVQRVGRV
jgi:branched-chain amino acid transport system permease protein